MRHMAHGLNTVEIVSNMRYSSSYSLDLRLSLLTGTTCSGNLPWPLSDLSYIHFQG